ncbi:hypothetical protein PIB30_005484 [Stylosanthes scabra]|uniref:Uncharacterized protein n=1 Tax=Stylosanthes scabra TaxID=79078 RepID=A0ABU6Z0R6_9FABA|nr:hypothetical protein [Stylosanthes scabra]
MAQTQITITNTNGGGKIPTQTTKMGGWHAAIFITCVEFAERFSFQGLSANLITYLTKELKQSIVEATENVNTWTGVSALFPLLGGFLTDSYFGRFNTIVVSSFIFLFGMVMLTLSVSVSVMKNEALFFISLYVLSLGDGGHKPCVQTFAADQFDEETEDQRNAKSSFFNLWYLVIVIACTSSVFIIVYLQDHYGWTLGIGVLPGLWAIAIVVFFLGLKRYKRESPRGSPFKSVAQVIVAAIRKWRLKDKSNPEKYWHDHDINLHSTGYLSSPTLEHTNQFRFLDKAMIVDEHDTSSNTRDPWRLCSLNQVEEVKLILRLIPAWLSCLMFVVVQSQLFTFFVKQGSTMNRYLGPHFQISPASLGGVVGVIILFAVAFYDRVFVPIARKFTGHNSGITVLQRIGTGLFCSTLCMVISALVEAKRVNNASINNNVAGFSRMSIWWLLPQYALLGIGDAFTIVGLQELFYTQMPESMRSVGAAAYISVVGIGNFVANAIIDVVMAITSKTGGKWLAGNNLNKAHLDYFYWVLAGLCAVNLCVYVCHSRSFVYKKVHV